MNDGSCGPSILGIDLGGSSIKAVLVNPAGGLISSAHVPFQDRNMEWAERIRSLVSQFERDHGRLSRIGLSAPGLASKSGRSIGFMPGRLVGIEGLDWTDFLSRNHPVPVLNDAHAALMGEVWQGAARGARDAFLLTLGTGVGGAAMVDGKLLKGHIGRAGHLGHIALNFDGPPDDVNTPGSLESEIGNKTILHRTAGKHPTTFDLVRAHEAGDVEATRIWLRSIKALGAGVASLVNVLDPEVVIIGGGIARAGNALFEPLAGYLAQMEWRPGNHAIRVVPAALGDLAGAYGAAACTIQNPIVQ